MESLRTINEIKENIAHNKMTATQVFAQMLQHIANAKKEDKMDTAKLRDKQELIAAKIHDAWWREKEKQGFHPPIKCPNRPNGKIPIIGEEEAKDAAFSRHCNKCHTDMYPYESLPEHVKEYDRVTVRAVLAAIERI